MNELLSSASVARVRDALRAAGSSGTVMALAETARTAQDAADSIGCPLGAIVKSLVFTVGGRPVMALVSGDRQCDTKQLGPSLGLEGKCRRADADVVRHATGFAIGGVAPLAHPAPLPTAVDGGLGRFETIYAAAGHPHCVFGTSLDELLRLTDGILSDAIGRSAG